MYKNTHDPVVCSLKVETRDSNRLKQKFANTGNLHRHLTRQHSKLTLDAMLEADGIKLPRAKSPLKKCTPPPAGPKSVTRPAAMPPPSEAIFLEPVCKLCQMDIKSALQSKRHYLHHFRKIFQV